MGTHKVKPPEALVASASEESAERSSSGKAVVFFIGELFIYYTCCIRILYIYFTYIIHILHIYYTYR